MPPPGTYKTERLNFQEILDIAILLTLNHCNCPVGACPDPTVALL